MLEREKLHLGQLRFKKKSIEEKIAAYQFALYEIEEGFQREAAVGLTILETRSFRFQMDNLNLQIEELKKEVEKLIPLIEQQLEVVINATQEVSGLEKLKEKQLEEYNLTVQKAEELIISEFVTLADFKQKNER